MLTSGARVQKGIPIALAVFSREEHRLAVTYHKEQKVMSKTAVEEKESGTQIFEDVFQHIRKASEANLKLQKEALQLWTGMWPGAPTSQPAWVDKMQKFQQQWCETVSSLAAKHRETMDQQYKATLESLDAALKVTESTNPEEFRRRSEQFTRKAIECLREVSETQVRELQQAATKWSELVTKAGK